MTNDEKNIVIVDDEKYVCNIIMEALDEFPEFRINKFTDPEAAMEYISENPVNLVLTDLVMGEHSGVEILETALANHHDAIVILMTGYPTVKTAISVLKKGGYDYLTKPFKLEDLKSTILRGLEHQATKRENVQLKSQLELIKVTDAAVGGMKLSSLLKLIVNSVVNELCADAASIVLLDKKGNKYRMRCLTGAIRDKSLMPFLEGGSLSDISDQKNIKPIIINEPMELNGKTLWRHFISQPLLSKGKNIGFLNLVRTDSFGDIVAGQKHLVSLLASTAAAAVESTYLDRNLQLSYFMTIKALAKAIEARDKYTAGHTDRVYRLAKIIATKLDWDAQQLSLLRTGAILHDIGKIGVPDSILNKPGKLTDEEFAIMKQHPEKGAKILKNIPFLEPIIPYVLSHHEKFDGTGYPYGLAGQQIPIEGRILAAADTVDAIMSDRPYRNGANPQKALEELTLFSGRQFDPQIVEIFIEAYNEGKINWVETYSRSVVQKESMPEEKVPV